MSGVVVAKTMRSTSSGRGPAAPSAATLASRARSDGPDARLDETARA
jgi:hypothetical protein